VIRAIVHAKLCEQSVLKRRSGVLIYRIFRVVEVVPFMGGKIKMNLPQTCYIRRILIVVGSEWCVALS